MGREENENEKHENITKQWYRNVFLDQNLKIKKWCRNIMNEILWIYGMRYKDITRYDEKEVKKNIRKLRMAIQLQFHKNKLRILFLRFAIYGAMTIQYKMHQDTYLNVTFIDGYEI